MLGGMVVVLVCGVALGALSRIHEGTSALSVVSTHPTWLLAAVLAGAFARTLGSGALAGAAALTAANAGYYALVAVSEDVPLASVAGSPGRWVVLGVAGGAAFGLAGAVARRRPGLARAAALAGVGAVLAGDAAGMFSALLP